MWWCVVFGFVPVGRAYVRRCACSMYKTKPTHNPQNNRTWSASQSKAPTDADAPTAPTDGTAAGEGPRLLLPLLLLPPLALAAAAPAVAASSSCSRRRASRTAWARRAASPARSWSSSPSSARAW